MDEKRYNLTTTGTVAALGYLQSGEGFIFYVRIFWGQNPDKPATDMINKALESIPEPWRNNIPDVAIDGLKQLAENKTSREALDRLLVIEKEVRNGQP